MTIQEILAGESKNLELKKARPDKSMKYMKSVVAFANGKGGHIVFGVDDDRNVVGIPEDVVFQEMDAIANAISDSCEPVIIPDIYPQTIEGKTVIVTEISAGRQKPYYIRSEGFAEGVYIRVSGTSRRADRSIVQELYYESAGRSHDSVIRRDLSVTQEEIDRLCAGMKRVAVSNARNEAQRAAVKDVTGNILLNWGILAEDEDGTVHPTNAWVYLTGRDPFLSRIQCGMFKGTTRAVFVDKRDYEGPLWEQVDGAFQFVLRNIRLGARIEGLYRIDEYELPPDSIRELIVNAVMNCSYLQASHVQVAIYDDRLEITTPGGLMPNVTIERMKEGYSQIRNRALAHAFSYMNMMEGWGTGIPRLLKDMEAYGLREPEFIDMDSAFRVNLYRASVETEQEKSAGEVPGKTESAGKVPETIAVAPEKGAATPLNHSREQDLGRNDEKRAGEVPEKDGAVGPESLNTGAKTLMIPEMPMQYRAVYQYASDNGDITTEDVQRILGIKDRRARTILKEMVDQHLLIRKGASRSTRYSVA